MASKSVKPDGPQGHKAMPSQALKGEGVETRRRPPTGCKVQGEGIVQGVQKWAQTGILWSQVQVLHGLPLSTTASQSAGAGEAMRRFVDPALAHLNFLGLPSTPGHAPTDLSMRTPGRPLAAPFPMGNASAAGMQPAPPPSSQRRRQALFVGASDGRSPLRGACPGRARVAVGR